MGGQRYGAQPPHHNGAGGKEPDLAEPCEADGQAKAENTGQHLPIGAPQADKHLVLRHFPQHVDHHGDQRHAVRRDRGDGRTAHAKLWRAPVAEDERIVGQHIRNARQQRDPEHDLCAFQRGEVAFQHHDHQRREDAPSRNKQIAIDHIGQRLILPHQRHDRPRPDHQRQRQHGKAHRQPHAHTGGAAQADLVALGVKGGDQRHHAPCKARPEDQQHEEIGAGEGDSGQRLYAVPARHDRIGDPDRDLPQMPAYKRKPHHGDGSGVARICHLLCHAPFLRRPARKGKSR